MSFLNIFKKKEKPVLHKVNISFEYCDSDACDAFQKLIKPLGFKEYRGSSRFDSINPELITRQYEFNGLYDYFIFFVESEEMKEFLTTLETHLNKQYKLSREDLYRKQDRHDELLKYHYGKGGAGNR